MWRAKVSVIDSINRMESNKWNTTPSNCLLYPPYYPYSNKWNIWILLIHPIYILDFVISFYSVLLHFRCILFFFHSRFLWVCSKWNKKAAELYPSLIGYIRRCRRTVETECYLNDILLWLFSIFISYLCLQ